MDITINETDATKETRRRNREAWEKFANAEDDSCRHCPHDRYDHVGESAPPAVLTPDNRGGWERRTLSEEYEILRLFCRACAEELGTSQVLCYRRVHAVGERVDNRA